LNIDVFEVFDFFGRELKFPDSVEKVEFRYGDRNGYEPDPTNLLQTLKNCKGLKSWETDRFVPIMGDEYEKVRRTVDQH
jgi:hypothetical protein